MLSQPIDTKLAVPKPEAPRTKKRLLIVVGIIILILAIGATVGALNGIILHDNQLMKPNANLSTPLIFTGCDSTQGCLDDQICVTSDGTNAGLEVKGKCYVSIFDTTDY